MLCSDDLHANRNRLRDGPPNHDHAGRIGRDEVSKVVYTARPRELFAGQTEVLAKPHDGGESEGRFVEELEHVRERHDG